MDCDYCLRKVEEYGPLSYCHQCEIWYKGEKEEQGVYDYCATKDTDPEKCHGFIQGLISPTSEHKEDEGINIIETTIANMRQADEICAACKNMNFVLDQVVLI